MGSTSGARKSVSFAAVETAVRPVEINDVPAAAGRALHPVHNVPSHVGAPLTPAFDLEEASIRRGCQLRNQGSCYIGNFATRPKAGSPAVHFEWARLNYLKLAHYPHHYPLAEFA
jgi:hypothetical protein